MRIFLAMRLHLDVSNILKWATQLAIQRGASEVGEEHLQDADPALPVSPDPTDLPLGRRVRLLLGRACVLAKHEASDLVSKRHLQEAWEEFSGQFPVWGEKENPPPLTSLLDAATCGALAGKGIYLESLRQNLQGLLLCHCRPKIGFAATEAGVEYNKFSQRFSGEMRADPLLSLLSCLLCRGPAAGPLEASGVTPTLLVQILEELLQESEQAFLPANLPPSSDQAQRLLWEGRKLLSRGLQGQAEHYWSAIDRFNHALRIDPLLADALAERSCAYLRLGDTESARRDAWSAIAMEGLADHLLAFLHLAFEGEEAREFMRQSLDQLDPGSSFVVTLGESLAGSYWFEGRVAEYIMETESLAARIEAQGEDLSVVMGQLGTAYEHLGQLEKAHRAYRKGRDGHSRLRLWLRQSGWTQAESVLREFAEMFSEEERAVYAEGLAEFRGTERPVSDETLAAAQQLGERDLYFTFLLALFLLRNGFLAKGRAILGRFCEICKANPYTWGVTLAWEIGYARKRAAV